MSNLVVFTTLNDEDLAEDMVTELLERNLILSASIFPGVKTMFFWEEEVHLDEECRIMLKMDEEDYDSIERYILEKHPYIAPEIIRMPASFGSDFFRESILKKKEQAK